MKNTFKKITYIALGIVFGLVALSSPKDASAIWVDYPYTIPYTVTSTPPPVITVDIVAIPDNMTLPTNQTVLTWTTTGNPTSCSAFGSWSGSYGGGNGTETMSGLAVGSYSYQIVCFKAGSFNAMDTVVVTVSPSGPTVTGSLTISPNTCVIANGASTCSVTGATWNTNNATSPQVIDGNTSAVLSTLANNATPLQIWVAYPSTTYYLKDGVTTLDSDPAFASCGPGSVWDGLACNPSSVVNGRCAATHWFCLSPGASTNNTGTGNGPWTWTCPGSGGGTNASCFQPAGGGGGDPECSDGIDNTDPEDTDPDNKDPGCHTDGDADNDLSYDPNDNNEVDGASGDPQCSDTIDNDGDTLVDIDDPGCHTDKDPNNPASYVPSDDDERNVKPIWIEI